MPLFTLSMVFMLTLSCVYILMMKKKLRAQTKLSAELHDRYALLWADYTRRGQRITLYEAGMTKACVDELDRKVLARIEKFAHNDHEKSFISQ